MKLKNFFLSCSSGSRSRKLKDDQQRFTANGGGTTSSSNRPISSSVSSGLHRDSRPMSPTAMAVASSSSVGSGIGGSGGVKETDLVDFVQEHPKKSLSAVYSFGNGTGAGGSVNKLPTSSSSGRIPGYHHQGSSTSLVAGGNSVGSVGPTTGNKYYQANKRIIESRGGAATVSASSASRRERERSSGRDRDGYYQHYQHQNGYHQHSAGSSGGAPGVRGVDTAAGGASYGNSRFYDDCYHHHHHNHHHHHGSSSSGNHGSTRYSNHTHHNTTHASSNNNKTSPPTSSHGAGGGSGGGSARHRNSSSENEHHNYRQNSLGVKKGDRVVWVREPPDSNESGVVRWTGVIEGEEIAGIEFDRSLGLGSGWYKNKQLFTCAPQRGGLVAVAGLILEDDYFYNPVISTKDGDEDIVACAESTGGEISPVRGDSSLSTSSGIGSGSGIHSSPSPSPSSSSSTSLDVGSYDTSSSTSSTSSGRNRSINNKGHHPRYTHLDNHQEDNSTTTITVSKGKGIVSSSSKSSLGQSDKGEKKVGWSSASQQQLPTVDCGEGPVARTRWASYNNNVSGTGTPSCPTKSKESDQTESGSYNGKSNDNNNSTMPIPFVQAPLREEDAERISGRSKGIQGHRNSCYLDATLFAMFSFSGVFDSILLHEWNSQKDDGDEELARNVQRILRDEVVNPLRKELYCTARNVMKLRETMQHLDEKLTSEEMDPQEFLQLLFSKVLNLDEFMSLSSGHSDFFHQVLVAQTDEDKNKIPTIQQLFEQSLILQELKLKTVPRPALILQMPRSGNKYKMYDGILPNLSIDITDLMEDIPRMCIICGSLATHECPSCYGKFSSGGEDRDNSSSTPTGSGAESTAFCETCLNQTHKRRDRTSHLSHIVPIKYSFDPSHYFSLSPLSPTSTTGGTNNHLFNNSNHHHNSNSSGAIPSYHFGAGGTSWATPGSGGGVGTGGGFVGGNPNFNRNPTNNGPLISTIPSPPSSYHAVVSSSRTIPRVTMDLFAVICIETSHFVSFVKCGTERQAPWVFFDSMADRVENPNGTGHNIPQVKLLPNMGVWLEDLEKSPKNIKDFMTSPEANMAPELRRLLSDPYICLYYSPQSCMYS